MALKVISVAASLVAVASCGAAAITAAAARQSLSPASRKRYDIVPLSVTDEEIELRATRRTDLPGIFGLDIFGEDEPAAVGPVIAKADDTVRRSLIRRPVSLSTDSRCRWSGIVAATPERPFSEIQLPTSVGLAPAWVVDKGSDVWAIHVHGQGSDRRQPLRGVASATTMGLNSLIVSYRNDGDAPASADRRSHLGESEWRDLEDALQFVSDRGGTKCIVFGWSLGATIAMNTLQRSRLAGMISGIVMVSPVLSWEAVLRANARHQGWPPKLGSQVVSLLGSKALSRLAGISTPLKIRQADASRLGGSLKTPILILHNRNDWSVPFETSARFAETHAQQVELVEFECSGHTQEWNSDPVGWDLAVRRWYGRLFQPSATVGKAEKTAGDI